MTAPLLFLPSIHQLPGGWQLVDASGTRLVIVYGDDRPKGVADTGLTMDEARRIATGVRRLQELLAKKANE